MKQQLRKRLLDDAATAALVGQNVDWLTRPRAGSLPALTLQMIERGQDYSHDGPSATFGSLVQLDAWGRTQAEADAVALAAIGELHAAVTAAHSGKTIAFTGGQVEGDRDLPAERLDGGAEVYRQSADIRIWWNEA
jgi:hypothetical protein